MFEIVDTSFSPARGYMEIVEKRDKHTLLNILKKVCPPCSKIHSNQWSAYRDIEILGFEHKTVNHSLHFVNSENGVHTQHIESYWNKQKIKIKSMKGVQKEDLNSYLAEFMWRERFYDNEFFKICVLLRSVLLVAILKTRVIIF